MRVLAGLGVSAMELEGVFVMPSGGARSRSGPPADLNSYRQRRNSDGWVELPHGVNRKRTPNWPLRPAPSDRERELWRSFWRQGQSIVWESQRQSVPLAIYVRLFVSIESMNFDVPASRLTQMRIMADDLGITLSGLLRNKWKFSTVEQESETQTAKAVVSATPTAARISALTGRG